MNFANIRRRGVLQKFTALIDDWSQAELEKILVELAKIAQQFRQRS